MRGLIFRIFVLFYLIVVGEIVTLFAILKITAKLSSLNFSGNSTIRLLVKN